MLQTAPMDNRWNHRTWETLPHWVLALFNHLKSLTNWVTALNAAHRPLAHHLSCCVYCDNVFCSHLGLFPSAFTSSFPALLHLHSQSLSSGSWLILEVFFPSSLTLTCPSNLSSNITSWGNSSLPLRLCQIPLLQTLRAQYIFIDGTCLTCNLHLCGWLSSVCLLAAPQTHDPHSIHRPNAWHGIGI